MILPRSCTVVRQIQTDENEQILFKAGYSKMYSCICPHCGVENIEDNFNAAIIGTAKTVAETWHKKDCVFVVGRVNTMFDANIVYVKF